MAEEDQHDLLSPISDLGLVRFLLADLHDDLLGKVARFRQLTDLSETLGWHGTMLPGGETTYAAWIEARTSLFMAITWLRSCYAKVSPNTCWRQSWRLESTAKYCRIEFTFRRRYADASRVVFSTTRTLPICNG